MTTGVEKPHQLLLNHNLTQKCIELKVMLCHITNISQMNLAYQSVKFLLKDLQLTTAMMPSYERSSLFWIDAITSNACPARSVTIT